jgi:hypothetical protein
MFIFIDRPVIDKEKVNASREKKIKRGGLVK